MSMKLAVIHNLPSGGALRVLEAQVRGLARLHCVEVFALATAEAGFVDLSSARAVHVEPFAPSAPLGRPFGMFDPLVKLADLARLDRAWRATARAVRAGGFDVALVHPCRFTQAPLVLEHLTVPSVYVCHEPPRALYEPMLAPPPASLGARLRALRHAPLARALVWRQKALDRAACRSASALVVVSAFVREQVRAIYAREPELIPPGVDAERFHPAAPPERGAYVLSVGALSPLKGFDLVLDVLARLPSPLRPPLALVADRGDGAFADQLREQAVRQGVELTIEVRLSERELVRRYQHARATVFFPVREPFGLVPLESMACGTPVVGVREGGVVETIEDGVTGLTAPRDADLLARQLQVLLGDPELAERLGRAGRARVLERWTWDASNARLEARLAALAGGAR